METEGLYIDQHGRVNHQHPARLSAQELLSVAQLHGTPLPVPLRSEVHRRGLTNEMNDLMERERCVPDN